MFVLAPSTRFGYFIYPAAMVLWLLAAQAGREHAGRPAPEVPVPEVPASGLPSPRTPSPPATSRAPR
jgi:hypothetical protein